MTRPRPRSPSAERDRWPPAHRIALQDTPLNGADSPACPTSPSQTPAPPSVLGWLGSTSSPRLASPLPCPQVRLAITLPRGTDERGARHTGPCTSQISFFPCKGGGGAALYSSKPGDALVLLCSTVPCSRFASSSPATRTFTVAKQQTTTRVVCTHCSHTPIQSLSASIARPDHHRIHRTHTIWSPSIPPHPCTPTIDRSSGDHGVHPSQQRSPTSPLTARRRRRCRQWSPSPCSPRSHL